MYTAEDFIRLNQGEFMDFDGSYGAQCVDLFNFYKKQVIGGGWMGTPSTGGAADLWNDFAGDGPLYFDKIPNTETSVPEYGDVIIWGANVPGITGPAGHVGIFVDGDVNSLTVFNQNYPNNSPCHNQHFPSYAGVLGYLRPKTFLVGQHNPVPAAEPVPVAEPAPVAPVVEPAPEVVLPGPAPVESAPEIVPIPTPVEPSTEDAKTEVVVDEPLTPSPVTQHTYGMKQILANKLLSRKLWLAVAAVITFVVNNQFDQALIVVLGYFGAQGYVDAHQ